MGAAPKRRLPAEPSIEMRAVDQVRPNPLNPRGPVDSTDPDLPGLVESVRANGILQPLLVTPEGVIVAGHRRHVAAVAAGLAVVPVLVRDLDERQQLEAMLVENLQRRALNPVQTATGCRHLRERGATLEQIAVRVGLTPTTVRAHLALLTLPPALQERCAEGDLPLGYVVHLVRLPTPELQLKVAFDAIRERWYVEQIARVVDRVVGPPPRKYPVTDPAPRKPESALPRAIELFTELTTTIRRHPALLEEAAVQDWIERLNTAARKRRR